MDMTLREIAALALDEWEEEANGQGEGEEAIVETADAAAADGGAAPAPAGAPAGGDEAGSGAPTNKAAATLQFNMQQHLDQYHGGQQPKGQCKYMDNLKAQAEAMGVADKVPGLNGGGAAGGDGATKVKESEGWKQYVTDRQVQDATFKEKLKALGVENPELNGSGYNEEQMKVVEEWHKDIDDRRDKYLKEALGEAEAHCVEQLADIIDAGGEKAEKALKLAEEIANKYPEGDPRHVGAEKMKDRAAAKKQKDEFDKRQAELDAKEKELKEREEALGRGEVKVKGEGEVDGENGNLGEVQVGKKTYVDLSGKDFWEGMAEAFKAGWNGKEIITDWDKMSGRWDKIRQGMTKKQKQSYENLMGGVADALQKKANQSAASQFEKHLGEESGLSDDQKAYIEQLYADWASADNANKRKVLKELNKYLVDQGLVKAPVSKKAASKKKGFDYDAYEPVESTKKTYHPVDKTALDSKLDSIMAHDDNSKTALTDDEKLDQMQKMEGLLNSVGLSNVKADDVIDGPMVSNIVLKVPEDGTFRKASIDNLKDNIETAFGLDEDHPVRITKNGNNIVVQVPKKNRDSVSFGDLYRSDEFKQAKQKMHLPIIIGRDSMGKPLIKDLTDLRHLLIAGETGGGKSVGLNNVLTSLMSAKEAGELDIDLVDLKAGIELGRYGNMPHLRGKVATDIDSAEQRIVDFKKRMDETLKKVADSGSQSIWEYNEKHPEAPLKPSVLAIDELAELIDRNPKVIEPLESITALGRAAGFSLIGATQRPDAKVIPGRLKANIPGTMAFKTKNGTNSSIILGEGETGAKDLLGKGDMIFSDGTKQVRAQGAFISNDEQKAINDAISEAHKENGGDTPTPPTAAPASPTPESISGTDSKRTTVSSAA